MGNCFSKDPGHPPEELSTALATTDKAITDGKLSAKESSTSNGPKKLLSERSNMILKDETVDSEEAAAVLDMGIQVIDLFQKVSVATEMVLPSPLGDVLEKVTSVLGVLKKMAENRQGWRGLLATFDEHQKIFNDQLMKLKVENMVPDPESPLLGPVIQYYEALEKLAAKIMEEGGLVAKEAPQSPVWERFKTFTTRAIHADDEQGSMDGYEQQLSEAMNQFKFTLEIFVGSTVDAIRVGVDSLASELKVVGEDVKEAREMAILNGEPKDTANAPAISAFGTQHKSCLQGTRVDVLEEIRDWAGPKENVTPVYCIADVSGTGKSTICHTMHEEWSEKEPTPLAFFFWREGAGTQTATDFCFFIKEQIEALGLPDLHDYWKGLAPSLNILRSQKIEQQWRKLVSEPLCLLPKSERRVLVVDALDECTVDTREPLLECILKAASSGSLPHIRIFITTRNEPEIINLLQHEVYAKTVTQKTIRNLPSSQVDVALYVNRRLDETGIFTSSPEQRSSLIGRCEGLFIFAFLACTLLEDACEEAKSLEDILHECTSLDVLFYQTLTRADRNLKYTRELLKNILGIIVVAHVPLSIAAIIDLLPTPQNPSTPPKAADVATVVGRLGSILGSGGIDEPVYILHATFKEFLLRQTWLTSGGKKATNDYAISKAQCNRSMARSCLYILLNELQENPKDTATSALRYAALLWISHLTPDLHIEDLRFLMRKLFQEKFLNWIELGGSTGTLPKYMLSLGQLRSSMKKLCELKIQTVADEDLKWCTDTLEFLRLNQTLIQQAPQNIYSSSIVFTPRTNCVYQQYEPRLRSRSPVVALGQAASGSQSTVLRGNNGTITRVAYSEAGDLLVTTAVQLYGQTGEIMVWDVQTGAQLIAFRLEGLSMNCYGVAFLPGNKTIVSVWDGTDGPYNRQLYRLDGETGDLVCPPHTLPEGDDMTCITWSPKRTHMLCGKMDGRMYRLSLEGMKMVGKIVQAHEDKINSLTFSSDGLLVSSTSADSSFKVWAVGSQDLIGPKYVWKSDGLEIYGSSFCPINPSLLAVAVGDTLQIHNTASGAVNTDCDQVDAFTETVYSPDGEYVAMLGYDQRRISLSKRENGVVTLMKLETGHTLRVVSVAFSPDGKHIASGSEDQTLRINDLEDASASNEVKGHLSMVRRMAFTLDCRRLASSDENGVICIWDMETRKLVEELIQTDTRMRNFIAYSSDGSTIATASMSDDIALWDVKTHAKLPVELALGYPTVSDQPLEIHAMVISPDDCTLAIMARGYFEDAGRELLCLKRLHEPSSIAITVEADLQPIPPESTLGYHPTGQYICCGGQAWDLNVTPPLQVAREKLPVILKETFPIFQNVAYESSPLLKISFGSQIRRSFIFPPDLNAYVFVAYDQFAVVGSEDGRVTVLDFTHLFTPEETSLFSRICDMKREAASRSGANRIHSLFLA